MTPTHQQQHMICYVYIARVSATSSEHETCRLTNPSDRHVPTLLDMIKISMAAVMAVASLICSHMAQTADQDDDYAHYCSTPWSKAELVTRVGQSTALKTTLAVSDSKSTFLLCWACYLRAALEPRFEHSNVYLVCVCAEQDRFRTSCTRTQKIRSSRRRKWRCRASRSRTSRAVPGSQQTVF